MNKEYLITPLLVLTIALVIAGLICIVIDKADSAETLSKAECLRLVNAYFESDMREEIQPPLSAGEIRCLTEACSKPIKLYDLEILMR